MKDPRDVIIEPVVSEKSLRPARGERVHVQGAPQRLQARDQGRRRERSSGSGSRR